MITGELRFDLEQSQMWGNALKSWGITHPWEIAEKLVSFHLHDCYYTQGILKLEQIALLHGWVTTQNGTVIDLPLASPSNTQHQQQAEHIAVDFYSLDDLDDLEPAALPIFKLYDGSIKAEVDEREILKQPQYQLIIQTIGLPISCSAAYVSD